MYSVGQTVIDAIRARPSRENPYYNDTRQTFCRHLGTPLDNGGKREVHRRLS